ncbi:PTS transporter subunit IIABC [Mycoplasmopsis pulmonis]|uniref:PTS transporter subunit IIABC n=1 Tax=Mycoplasmopsis pulmonis TaxID=2107 RepID=UPI002ACDA345|nr:glucose PTS transporter subunit IIA [Mycoplasmopsis pulmonis]MDZ7293359.1 glucose PTS transporter subunit IIA [Mycoplasmopsis pulmonis]
MTILKKLNFKKEKSEKSKINNNSGKLKKLLSKISGAFMLPIAIMSIAGIFLGVGAAIATGSGANEGLKLFGLFIQNMGDPIFSSLPLLFAAAFVIAFTEEAGAAVFAAIIAYLVFSALQAALIEPLRDSAQKIIGYKVLFESAGRDPESLIRLVGSSVGFTTLQTSVFGGISVGLITSYLYNKFHKIQFHPAFSFFAGKRFVPLVAILAMVPLSLTFLLFWPWVGKGLSVFGTALGKVPYGIESFIFGFIERSLIPFGLHHVFYAPLWYSNAGGDAATALSQWQQAGNQFVESAGFTAANIQELIDSITKNADKWVGDSTGWQAVNSLNFNVVSFRKQGSSEVQTLWVLDFFAQEFGIKLGRFLQGKYVFMSMGLPAAAFAMVMAAPKENRKVAFASLAPAAFTCFLTGITEPLEFTFLLLSPFLFWGFHAFMCALAFLLMNVLGAHIGMTFSGGFIDYVIYGLIPIQKGTHAYWVYVVAPFYAPIYFFVFYFWIKFKNLDTPGRGQNIKLFTKKDFRNKNKNKNLVDPQVRAVVLGLGGWDNITKYENCASRLRYDVVDFSKIDENRIKSAGATAIRRVGSNHIQIIVGSIAEQLNQRVKASIGQSLEKDSKQSDSNDKNSTSKANLENPKTQNKNLSVYSVFEGNSHSIVELNDGVFSEKMLGDGVFVEPNEFKGLQKVYAPVSGKLLTLFETKHAYGITTNEGIEILVHIGVDTVNLKGQGFKTNLVQGQDVKIGDVLAEVDYDFLSKQNLPSMSTIVVITNMEQSKITNLKQGPVALNQKLFDLEQN